MQLESSHDGPILPLNSTRGATISEVDRHMSAHDAYTQRHEP